LGHEIYGSDIKDGHFELYFSASRVGRSTRDKPALVRSNKRWTLIERK
jgi:hypothetical protein